MVDPSRLRHPSQAQRTDEVAIVGECPGAFRTGLLGSVTVTAWFGPIDLRATEALAHVTRDVAGRVRTERTSSVHLLDPSVGFPDAAARESLAKLSRESAEQMGCVCVVLYGGGFWASAIRGFLTGLHTLAPNMFDIHASATADQVLSYLPAAHEKRTGVALSTEALQRLLEVGQSWRSEIRAQAAG